MVVMGRLLAADPAAPVRSLPPEMSADRSVIEVNRSTVRGPLGDDDCPDRSESGHRNGYRDALLECGLHVDPPSLLLWCD